MLISITRRTNDCDVVDGIAELLVLTFVESGGYDALLLEVVERNMLDVTLPVGKEGLVLLRIGYGVLMLDITDVEAVPIGRVPELE